MSDYPEWSRQEMDAMNQNPKQLEINRIKEANKSGYRESGEALTDRACARCAHYRRREQLDFLPKTVKHRCERPQLGSTHDRVIGADIPNSRDAYDERRERVPNVGPVPADVCGPEGKFWSQSGF